MQFCQKVLGMKKSTQNDFVHGEHSEKSEINEWFRLIF